MWKSYKHGLEEEDVPGVNKVDSCRAVSREFDKAWAIEENKSKARSLQIEYVSHPAFISIPSLMK